MYKVWIMTNLIDHRVDPSKLREIRLYFKNKHNKTFTTRYRNLCLSLAILVSTIITSTFFYTYNSRPAEAIEFGLGNNYEEVIAMNERFSGNVPLSISSITTSNISGDERVVALLIFLTKYNSPMATPSVAKAFVDSADKYGFGDKWHLLPAIAGIESGFGRLIPYHGNKSSYNAWGWSGGSKYGRWSYFESWEDAINQISKGIANGYKNTNFEPEKMMATYCPPCALPKNKGIWAKAVNGYIKELQNIHDSL